MKTILLLFSLFYFNELVGQVAKESWLLGGQVHFSHDKNIESNTRESSINIITIAPKIGKAIAKNWIVGLQPVYRKIANKSILSAVNGSSTTRQQNLRLSLQLFTQNYLPIAPKLAIPLLLRVEYGNSKATQYSDITFIDSLGNSITDTYEDYPPESNGFWSTRFQTGLLYFITPQMNVNITASFIQVNKILDNTLPTNFRFGLNLSNVSVGMEILLKKQNVKKSL